MGSNMEMEIVYLTDLYSVRYRNTKYSDDFCILTEEYRVIVDGETFTAPAGMPVGPSIPRRARGSVGVTETLEASVIHDLNYRTGQVSRKRADDIFREMVKDRSGSYRAWKAWAALRMFGAANYNPSDPSESLASEPAR